MSSQASAAPSLWEGGRSPYATNSKKFGMWLFIISDSLTFSAMLFAYTYSRVTNPDWPKPFDFSPAIIFSTVMTFCLLSSSLTMVMAVHAMNHGNRKATVRWILATMVARIQRTVALRLPWFMACTAITMVRLLERRQNVITVEKMMAGEKSKGLGQSGLVTRLYV